MSDTKVYKTTYRNGKPMPVVIIYRRETRKDEHS